MKKEKIEDIFSSIEHFSSVPPPELWAQIEEKLDKPKKKKRAILWWSAAACLLLGLMLPSVLRLGTDSGTKNVNTNATENNSIVLDENKVRSNTEKVVSTEENTSKVRSVENETSDKKENQPGEANEKTQTQETAVAHADSENKKPNNTIQDLNAEKKNTSPVVAEKSLNSQKANTANASAKMQSLDAGNRNNNQAVVAKSFNTQKANTANTSSKIESLGAERNSNKAVAEKSFSTQKTNTANSSAKIENLDAERNNSKAVAEKSFSTQKANTANSSAKIESLGAERNTNKAVAEKSFSTQKANTANSSAKIESLGAERNTNKAVAEKSFSTDKQNVFHSPSNLKNQNLDPEKRKANQILAEKTFTAGKQNPFVSTPKNQVAGSIFEEKTNSKNSKNNHQGLALNSSKSNKPGSVEQSRELRNESNTGQKTLAQVNQNSSAKFNTAILSKQDSVQLAELQNLEKGIVSTETKKENEKEKKSKSNAERWAVEVFAGVANSENTKNDKTLGHVNDSKQSNSYGVKTKYKINNRWAVGSGLKINELGQSVADVSYMNVNAKDNAFSAVNSFAPAPKNSTVSQVGSNNNNVLFVSSSAREVLQSENVETGKIDQSLKYIEMPFEVSYAVFNKNKATISLNTGGFVGKLISNTIAIDGQSLGENVDANDYVYGSTLSSTLQYRIYKKTNVFVEPAMNYYLNPLNNQSFNQLQWGFNFGLNVSF